MMMMRSIAVMTLCILLFLVAGCGSGDVTVTGQLYRQGELYKPEQGEQVMVVFEELKDGQPTGKAFPTRLSADGSFKIAGPDNTGIKAGSYRVGVSSRPEVPVPGQPMADKFQGAYDSSKSPLKYDITPSSRNIKVELP